MSSPCNKRPRETHQTHKIYRRPEKIAHAPYLWVGAEATVRSVRPRPRFRAASSNTAARPSGVESAARSLPRHLIHFRLGLSSSMPLSVKRSRRIPPLKLRLNFAFDLPPDGEFSPNAGSLDLVIVTFAHFASDRTIFFECVPGWDDSVHDGNFLLPGVLFALGRTLGLGGIHGVIQTHMARRGKARSGWPPTRPQARPVAFHPAFRRLKAGGDTD